MTEAIKADAQTTAQELIDTLSTSGLQIGWWGEDTKPVWPDGLGGWILKVIGLLVTVLAMSMGAQFWFDILKSLIALRKRKLESAPASKPEAVTPPGTPILETAKIDEPAKPDKPSKSKK